MIREIKKELRKGPVNIEMPSRKFEVSRERIEDTFRLLLNLEVIEEISLSDCREKEHLLRLLPP